MLVLGWLAAASRPRPRTPLERLRATPVEQLDDAIRALLRTHAPEEVREAMVERLKEVPLSHFGQFKRTFFKFFAP